MHVETNCNARDLYLQSAVQIQQNKTLHHLGEEPRSIYSCLTGDWETKWLRLMPCPNEPSLQPTWDPKADPHLTVPTMLSEKQAPCILQMVSCIRRSPNPILNHRNTTFGAWQGRRCSHAVPEVIGLNFSPSNTMEFGEGEPPPVLL